MIMNEQERMAGRLHTTRCWGFRTLDPVDLSHPIPYHTYSCLLDNVANGMHNL